MKTLNDIPMQTDIYLELKAEAIKWIKWKLENSNLKIAKMTWENNKLTISWKGTDKFSAGFIQGIAEFFNITEEDLK